MIVRDVLEGLELCEDLTHNKGAEERYLGWLVIGTQLVYKNILQMDGDTRETLVKDLTKVSLSYQ
jgi:hypothetical protein